jgi:hypothetical protein
MTVVYNPKPRWAPVPGNVHLTPLQHAILTTLEDQEALSSKQLAHRNGYSITGRLRAQLAELTEMRLIWRCRGLYRREEVR